MLIDETVIVSITDLQETNLIEAHVLNIHPLILPQLLRRMSNLHERQSSHLTSYVQKRY